MAKITVAVGEGSFTIDSELLAGYQDEAFKALDAEAKAKQDFKDEVESATEGVESSTVESKEVAKLLGKYFKAKYKEATAEAKDVGAVFEAFDAALEN